MKISFVSYVIAYLFFFLLITIFNQWFSLEYAPFWIAGLIGLILPDIDQLVYIYFLRPHELSSIRADKILKSSSLKQSADFIKMTHEERKYLVFHSAIFQIIFLIFSFLVVSSSSNLVGKGLVLSFSLHLLIDQLIDLIKKDNLDSWFSNLALNIDKELATIYWMVMALSILTIGLFF